MLRSTVEVREQVVALEHHADVLPELLQRLGVDRRVGGERMVGDHDRPCWKLSSPFTAAQQGALARAAAADDRDHLAARDRQRDAVEHLQGAELLCRLEIATTDIEPSLQAPRQQRQRNSTARNRSRDDDEHGEGLERRVVHQLPGARQFDESMIEASDCS